FCGGAAARVVAPPAARRRKYLRVSASRIRESISRDGGCIRSARNSELCYSRSPFSTIEEMARRIVDQFQPERVILYLKLRALAVAAR
ncbi:MAG: hypothetical protein ACRD27_08325, partial [Terracidiphilus sp.]